MRSGDRPLVASRREAARGSIVLGGGSALIALAVVAFVTVVPADATENTLAGPAQKAAAAKAFQEYFGAAATSMFVQYVACFFGQPGTVSVTGHEGSLTLAWPGLAWPGRWRRHGARSRSKRSRSCRSEVDRAKAKAREAAEGTAGSVAAPDPGTAPATVAGADYVLARWGEGGQHLLGVADALHRRLTGLCGGALDRAAARRGCGWRSADRLSQLACREE
ncbi:hypothetical protein ACFC26_03120 [Kitasatospora purpeofusca]|uniref:hypothetical protein n=1 Tax=Kitasatospora purpeofusca TaxID=67352 RepID=UPI0035D6EFCC